MACLSDSMHVRFAGGELPHTLELALSKHLDACPDCRSRNETLSRDQEPVQAKRSRVGWRPESVGRTRTVEGPQPAPGPGSPRDRFPRLERQADDATHAEPVESRIDPSHAAPPPTARRDGETAPSETIYRLLSAKPTDEVAGIRLGRFVIQRWLGAGGFGIVFLAHDDLLHRDVALKLPQAGALARPEARERFLCEAEAAAQLYHPNVVPVFEAGEEEGICYIASAYCSGPTLDRWLAAQTEPVSVQVATSLIRQLARAVEHAHSQRVLHRDIKPSNILLEPWPASSFGYTPKLTDFGLAKIIDADMQMTGNHGLLGTPRYMAPEQALSKAGSIGPATDVFALGAVLYEMLTGVAPYAGDDYARTLHRLLYEQADPPRQLRPDIPRDLEAILLKCLAKESSDRYGTARALAEDLWRFQEGHATRARPIGRLETLRRWMVRQPANASLLMVAGVAVLSLMGMMVAYNRSLQEFNASIQRALTLTQLAKADGENHRERLGGMLYVSKIQLAHKAIEENDLLQASRLLADIRDETPALASDFVWRYLWNQVAPEGREIEDCGAAVYFMEFSPSGSRMAACGADGVLRIYDGATLAPITAFPTGQGELNSAVFSPDERSIATAGDDGTVRLWDAETGSPRLTIQVVEAFAYDAVFTPDGTTLVTCGRSPMVHAWDVASGRLKATFAGHTRSVQALAIAPDGIHFASACSDNTIRIWDLTTLKTERVLRGHSERVMDVQYSPDGEHLLSGSIDQTVRLWRAADGEPLQTDRHLDAICSVAFAGDHRHWLASDRGGTVHIWQRRSNPSGASASESLSLCWKAHEGRAWEAITRNGTEVVTAGADGKIYFWGTPSPPQETIPLAEEEHVHAFAIDSRSERMHFSNASRGMEYWEFASRRRAGMSQLPSHPQSPQALCMLPNQVLVKAKDDGSIEGLDLFTRRVRFRLHAEMTPTQNEHAESTPTETAGVRSGQIVEVKASADGHRLAFFTRAIPRTYLYAIPAGTLIGQFQVVNHSTTMALSSDGRRLAMMDDDRVVVWDTDRQQRIAELSTCGESVFAIEFCPQGRYLAAGAGDRRIRVWDLDQQDHPLRTLDGHLAEIHSLCFSPDGELLASGDARGEIKFWFLPEAVELLTIKTSEPIRKLCFSPDGHRLVDLSENKIELFHAPIPANDVAAASLASKP